MVVAKAVSVFVAEIVLVVVLVTVKAFSTAALTPKHRHATEYAWRSLQTLAYFGMSPLTTNVSRSSSSAYVDACSSAMALSLANTGLMVVDAGMYVVDVIVSVATIVV